MVWKQLFNKEILFLSQKTTGVYIQSLHLAFDCKNEPCRVSSVSTINILLFVFVQLKQNCLIAICTLSAIMTILPDYIPPACKQLHTCKFPLVNNIKAIGKVHRQQLSSFLLVDSQWDSTASYCQFIPTTIMSFQNTIHGSRAIVKV